jgi:proliferating cell nuclear antigen
MEIEQEDLSKYTLYVKTVQGGALRSLFEVLCHIVHDTNLSWEPLTDGDDDKGGLRVLTMDGARCALIFLRLDAESFDEYHCPGQLVTGVNMTSLWKLLKTASSHDTITLYIEAASPHELGITITNSEKNARTNYSLKLLDCDSETIKIPEAKFDRVLTLPSAYFQRLCREMTYLGEFMRISTDGVALTLSCDGSFASQSTTVGEADGCMAITETTGESVEGTFSLRYLSLFTRASGLCNTVQLFLKKDYPLVLSYSVASLGSLKFCLANRIED